MPEYWQNVREKEESHINTYGLMTPTVSCAMKDYEAIETLKELVNDGNSLEDIDRIIESYKDDEKNRIMLSYASGFIDEYKKTKGVLKNR